MRSEPARASVGPACSSVGPARSSVEPACSSVGPACSSVGPACSSVELPLAPAEPGRPVGRWRQEHGNTLLLFPTAILIILGMGAVALDSATVFLGQRRLVDIAAAVANDAIAAVDVDAFFAQDAEGAAVPLSRARAEARRDQIVARQVEDRSLSELTCRLEVLATGPPARAEVVCEATVRPILAPVWPGAPLERQVRAREVAVGVQR